jgi:hypothetical protein
MSQNAGSYGQTMLVLVSRERANDVIRGAAGRRLMYRQAKTPSQLARKLWRMWKRKT